MDKKEFQELVVNHEQDIKSLQKEMQKIQKELEMFGVFKKIFAQGGDDAKLKELQQHNQELKNRFKDLELLNATLEKEHQQLNTQLHSEIKKNATLTEKNLRLEKELKSNPLQKIVNLYHTLDETTKNGTKNILKSKNELTLFASATLSVKSLWDYLRYLRKEHKDKEFEILQEIVDTVLQTYVNVTDVSYQTVKEGDEFDNEFHIRDNRSEEYDGAIKKVVLQGLVENDRIVKKAIVIV